MRRVLLIVSFFHARMALDCLVQISGSKIVSGFGFQERVRSGDQIEERSLSAFSWERIMATSATAAIATMYQAGAMLEPVA